MLSKIVELYRKRKQTGYCWAKKIRFSSETNPPPLQEYRRILNNERREIKQIKTYRSERSKSVLT